LVREYRFLRHKYQLAPLDGRPWKFMRLRPAAFPTLRLAQFAALLHRTDRLFGDVLDAEDARGLEALFAGAAPGAYWQTHYQFDRPVERRDRPPGRDFIHSLLINTVAPVWFHYGKTRQEPGFQEKALALLETLPAEENAVVAGWKKLGAAPRHAADTQALLHLKTAYCDARRCLECAVGHALLKG
jgi:hypothetical protein